MPLTFPMVKSITRAEALTFLGYADSAPLLYEMNTGREMPADLAEGIQEIAKKLGAQSSLTLVNQDGDALFVLKIEG